MGKPEGLGQDTKAAEVAVEVAGRPSSWDEFTTLREVIVGDAQNARMPPVDRSMWLTCYPDLRESEVQGVRVGKFPRRVIEEANEDLAALVDTFQSLGVRTHQPVAANHERTISSPFWTTEGFYSYCPRDLTLVVGDVIIETPSAMRSRYFELAPLRPLLQQYADLGANWLSAPRPLLTDGLFLVDAEGYPELGETEPIFDAANVLRLGRDVFYQVSRSGNEAGYRWLKQTLATTADVRVHALRGLYENTHIDSTIALLRPGLVLLNPARVREIPELLRNWDVIWCPPPEAHPSVPNALSEEWISMNLLMVRPDLAIVDGRERALVRQLEQHGVEVMPHRLRHARALGGGFHCVTLDIRRDGGPVDYL